MQKNILASESVGKGHPDKICDQIADAILDACLAQDLQARVACEVLITHKLLVIGGEISMSGWIDFQTTAWSVLVPLGYTKDDFVVVIDIKKQSKELKQALVTGANDQIIVYGYATDETPNYMPLSVSLAHDLLQRIEKYTKTTNQHIFKLDMKTQVFVDYDTHKIAQILLSVQHYPNVNCLHLTQTLNDIIDTMVADYGLNYDFLRLINPTKSFIIGGVASDSGLTGRKIMVDSYGTIARHGGGAFSGKDITKLDRSGAYYARYVAINLVAAGLVKKCEIQLCYGIGINDILSFHINTFQTHKVSLKMLYEIVSKVFDFQVSYILHKFKATKINFLPLAVYGHFGRKDLDLWWEKPDQINQIKSFWK